MNKSKKLTIVLVAVVLIIIVVLYFLWSNNSSSPLNPSHGQVFIPPTGNFVIDFPGQPVNYNVQVHPATKTASQFSEYDYSYYASSTANYDVSYDAYPSDVDVSVPEDNLKGALNAEVNFMNGVVSTSTFENYGKYQTLSYQFYSNQHDAYAMGKDVIAGHNFYQIQVLYRGTVPSDANEFIDSFQLTN